MRLEREWETDRKKWLMSTRFQDDGRRIWDFIEDILVECPSCGGCAHVLPKDPRHARLSGARRVSCLRCGYSRDAASGGAKKARPRWEKRQRVGKKWRQASTSTFTGAPRRPAHNAPADWFFGLPLYLQTPCAGETLWALNARHLAWIEAFLSAKLREDASPTRHKTAVSGLPQWLIVARRRDEALRGVARLRSKLLA